MLHCQFGFVGKGGCVIGLLLVSIRVGGGIYTKAAGAGADRSGKNDYGLDEDDYRNKARGSLAASSSSASSARAVA